MAVEKDETLCGGSKIKARAGCSRTDLEGAVHECLVQVQRQALLASAVWRRRTHLRHALRGVSNMSVCVWEASVVVRNYYNDEWKGEKESCNTELNFSARVE